MNKLKAFNSTTLKDTKIKDAFWSKYIDLVREVVIPYQWEALNDRIPDAEPSYAINNFKIAAGEAEGEFGGMVFQDSDVGKWVEAVAYSLSATPNPELEKIADSVVDLLAKAQQPDGYLNTYFTIKEPEKRWTNLRECHELYSAGHLFEAAAAYYEATGKKKILDVLCKYADYIDSILGPEPEKVKGYPGHEEVELALVKLFRVTGNGKYLKLSKYFIDERGTKPNYFDIEWEKSGGYSHWSKSFTKNKPDLSYNQAHLPVREQKEAVGHAVRAVYLYTGMADIAAETGDKTLLEACRTLWNDIVNKKMYITGGIGSTNHGEAFTFAYDLPNDTIYAETCASIGLIFFANRMLQMEAKSTYADTIERALYNVVNSSMALDGKHFFYVNPMEVWPEASEKNPSRHHVKPVRQKWFGCACCPPNVARLLSSLGKYIYTTNDNSIYTHLYIAGECDVTVNNSKVKLTQTNNYPWEGNISFKVSTKNPVNFNLVLRIPGWCKNHSIKVNGNLITPEYKDGYAIINRQWVNGDTIDLELEIKVTIMHSRPEVRANLGKVAIMRGPLVYCIEENDNGDIPSAISISSNTKFTESKAKDIEGNPIVLEFDGFKLKPNESDASLYSSEETVEVPVKVKAIPYYTWGNRKPGEMTVWIRQK